MEIHESAVVLISKCSKGTKGLQNDHKQKTKKDMGLAPCKPLNSIMKDIYITIHNMLFLRSLLNNDISF